MFGDNPPLDANGLLAVTVPTLLLKYDQSAELNTPRFDALAVGTFNVITGVVVPVATLELKSVPIVPNFNAATDVTVPTQLVLLLNVFQSVEVNKPVHTAEAVEIPNVIFPEDVTGELPIVTPGVEDVRPTLVTVPKQEVLLLKVFQSVDVSNPVHVAEAVEMLIPSVPLPVIGLPDKRTPVVVVDVATDVTVPVQLVLLLNVFQSAAVNKPVQVAEAVDISMPNVPDVVTGLPDNNTPVVDVQDATFVTVPTQVV